MSLCSLRERVFFLGSEFYNTWQIRLQLPLRKRSRCFSETPCLSQDRQGLNEKEAGRFCLLSACSATACDGQSSRPGPCDSPWSHLAVSCLAGDLHVRSQTRLPTDTVPEPRRRASLRAGMQGLTFSGQTAVRPRTSNAFSTEASRRQSFQSVITLQA